MPVKQNLLSLRVRFFLAIFLPNIILIAAVSIFDCQNIWTEVQQEIQLRTKVEIYEEHASWEELVQTVPPTNRDQIDRDLKERLKDHRDILFLEIRDPAGKTKFRYEKPNAKIDRVDQEVMTAPGHQFTLQGNNFYFETSLKEAGRQRGWVRGYVSAKHLYNRLWDEVYQVLIISITAMALALFIAIFCERLVTRPLVRVTNFVRQISESHDFQNRLQLDDRHEAGRLKDGINYLLEIIAEREESLRLALRSADAASRAKTAFLANMSHELRTPINHIIGYCEMIGEELEDLGETELVSDLQKASESAHSLITLIDNVLELTRIEAGRAEVDLSTFSVKELIHEVADVARPWAKKRDNEFILELADDFRPMRSDRARIRHSLLALLDNAAKFTSKGKVTLRVYPSQDDQVDRVYFDVEDTGIGIASELVNNLYQPFVQADMSSTRQYDGGGLGLAVTKRYSRLLGGKLRVKTELGQGSTFRLILPLELQAGKEAISGRESSVFLPVDPEASLAT